MALSDKTRVLVIDDDPGICQALSLHLKFRGMDVITVQRGRDGLDLLPDGEFDIVLTDIGLPDTTGHEVVKETMAMFADGSWPEIIVMTGNPTLDNAVQSLKEGAFQFVTKPLSMPFLEVVVDRALQHRKLRCRVEEMSDEQESLVLRSLADITGEVGLSGALESIIRAAQMMLNPQQSAIWLQDGPELRTVAVQRTDEAAHPLDETHEAVAQRAVTAGRMVCESIDERHLAATPIRIEERIEGVFTFERHGTPIDPDDDGRRLEALASFAASAVRKERLFADLQQSSMQISSLFEVGLAMSSEVSLQRLFEVVVDSASRICGAQRCSLMLIDHDGETMRIRAARGIPPEIVAKAEGKVGEGISGTVAAKGEALFIANIERDGSFSKDNDDSKYNNASLICVPVLVHDKVVGVLNVNNKQGGISFTENDLNLLTLLASQAAVAIDNAHRYQDLSEQAITDGLTGIYIRRHFDETLARAYRTGRATGRGFGLLMIDIDHFKSVNDNYGHQTGDEALRTVAGILRTLVRDEDCLARYGGEEFAIIISRANEKATRRIAERIRSTVESTPVETEAHTLHITVSVGGVVFGEHHKSPEAVVEEADQSLYRAKEGGRNRVVLATDGA